MAKIPKKDINLYPLVVTPKKNTVKKGALFAVVGAVAVVLLAGSYISVRVYVKTQENVIVKLQEKANDAALLEKIQNANAVAADITTLRTAGNAYTEVRKEIDQSRSYCDDFSEDLIEQLLSCEYYTSPVEGQLQIATITALSYDGTTLSITANSPDSQNVSAFVNNLTRLDLFSDISYTGYSLSDDVYTYTINAVFVKHVYETEEATGETAETTTEVAQ